MALHFQHINEVQYEEAASVAIHASTYTITTASTLMHTLMIKLTIVQYLDDSFT